MACQCGHHEKTHFGLTGLCGAADGCPCNKFVEAKPAPASPKRYAEMTPDELQDWIHLHAIHLSWRESLAALRDAILAERASEVIGMRDTIDALRTRAERAERERDAERVSREFWWQAAEAAQKGSVQLEADLDNTVADKHRIEQERDDAKADFLHAHNARVTAESDLSRSRDAHNAAIQERDALKDEVAGFEAMWEEREKAHDAALGEAKRRAFCDGATWEAYERDSANGSARDEAARRYPATPSGEGVKWCGYCAKDRMPNTPCVCATPQPSEPVRVFVRRGMDEVVRLEGQVLTVTFDREDARRLLALAQTGEK
jgi:hypothetical protein